MSALQQYIDLYTDNHDIIDANSAPALNRLRRSAFEALSGKHLPTTADEGYVKTSIDEMFEPDYGLNITRLSMPVDIAGSFRCDVPNLSTLLAIVANDTFIPTTSLENNLPEGVEMMSLSRAAVKHADIVEKYYGSIAPLTDVSTALNTLLAQDGVFIYLPRGTKLNRPLQIVNIISSPQPIMAVRRILVVAEDDASADIIICDHTQSDKVPCAISQVVEIVAHKNSGINLIDIEESTPSTHRMNQVYVNQADESTVDAGTATLLNGTTRNEFRVNIAGRHATSHLYGMATASSQQHIDNFSSVVHSAPQSKSQQRFRYVLDDNATGAFEGGIEVTPGASGTEAYQSNGNVLASANARMHTEPQLLIYNDDVKCSHGASTGQLDQQALFYMQTRGIPLDEARTMLMQAFLTDVIESVRPESVRDRLRHLVEKRFSGTLATCQGCNNSACH